VLKFTIGPYIVQVHRDSIPDFYSDYCPRAVLFDEFDTSNNEGAFCFVSVALGDSWPMLVVAQRFSPSLPGFEPGVLLVPDTKTLFIGAGERLLAYRLDPLARLWEDRNNSGFWHWRLHGHTVLMAAELEIAAWDSHGNKRWTTFVEPPWDFRIEGDRVLLDVMGRKSEFSLESGPSQH
jgi:hypothetical protein